MKSIVEAVAVHAKVNPDKICIADGKRELTYREYWECIYGFAKKLKKIGIKKGDCVVVQNMQNIETLVAGLAIQLLKGIFVPVERGIADARIREISHIVNAACYIASKEVEHERGYIHIRDVLLWQDCDAEYESFPFPEDDDIAEILFTTGTTGVSKGIELTHRSVIAVSENVIGGVEMQADNMEIIPVPLNHSHGLRRYYANILNGSSVVIINGVTLAKKFYDCIEKYNVTAIDLVPAALSSLLKMSGNKLADYKEQLRYVQLGSAPIAEQDKEALCAMLPHTKLYNFYGTTESGCSCIIDFNMVGDKKNCIGKPTCHANFVFLDENGNLIEATEKKPGLLACAGEMNMVGYYNASELTKSVMLNGYIRTQDLAYRGEDGFIYLLGRQGDVIESGGHKISPMEIEETALLCEMIEDCACVPVDSEILGKEPKLFVVIKPGHSFDYSVIYGHMKKHLENYKVPRFIEEIDAIPRTFNGKIKRTELK